MSKLVTCKACGKEVAKGAKCPSCGNDQRNFFMKHKIISGIITLVIIGVIGSMSNKPEKVGENTSAANGGTVQSDKTKNSSSNADNKKQPQTFKVGDIVQLKDFKVSANKVYSVAGNQFAKPKDGNEFIAIDCTIENISDKEQVVSSILMFKVVDKDGRACENSIMGQMAANAGQMDGTVGAGRKLTGVYVVEVPKGTTGLELEFNTSFLTGGQIIVKLN